MSRVFLILFPEMVGYAQEAEIAKKDGIGEVFLGVVIGLVFFKVITVNLFISFIGALVILGILKRIGKNN